MPQNLAETILPMKIYVRRRTALAHSGAVGHARSATTLQAGLDLRVSNGALQSRTLYVQFSRHDVVRAAARSYDLIQHSLLHRSIVSHLGHL